MFEVGGEGNEPSHQAEQAIAVETALAKMATARSELLDPEKSYHKLSRAQFGALAPNLNLPRYLELLGYRSESILVSPPAYFEALGTYLTTASIDSLKAYAKFRVIVNAAKAFSPESIDLANRFEMAFTGQAKPPTREFTCVTAVGKAMGSALSREYVRDYFSPAAKVAAQKLIADVEAAFKRLLQTTSWLDAETRVKALNKFAKLGNKVGYPDQWRDYTDLDVKDGPYLQNLVAAGEFEFRDDLLHVGRPIDRQRWAANAFDVNAYYSRTLNEMVILAGILRPPFFDANAEPARNFGAIGMIIGHELIHGYDSSGRLYDEDGHLKNWWSETSGGRFVTRSQCLVDEYSAFAIGGGGHVDGRTTLTENIADNGGIKVAYAAFVKRTEKDAATVAESASASAAKDANRWTPAQRFFISHAQLWCSKATDQTEQALNVIDTHSPGRYRVRGVEANFPEFARAFNCPAASQMIRAPRCEVW